VAQYLSEQEYGALQQALMTDPEAGAVVPGSGDFAGLPQDEANAADTASSTSFGRVPGSSGCSPCTPRMWPITSPLISCGKFGRKLKMANKKRDIGREILDGLRELKEGRANRVVNVPDVAKVREKTGLSQSRFAELLGVSVRTLQDWEQGRRAPSGAARTLLLIADRSPRVLLDVA
jgi:putative transcriptional regulator